MSLVGRAVKGVARATGGVVAGAARRAGDSVVSVIHQRKCFFCRQMFYTDDIRKMVRGRYEVADMEYRYLGKGSSWVCYGCIPRNSPRC